MTTTPRPGRLFRPRLARGLGGALPALLAALMLAGASGHACAEETVPGEVLLQLRTSAALGGVLQRQHLTLVDRFGARPIYRVKVIGPTTVASALAGLAAESQVVQAEPNRIQRHPEANKNNPWAIGNASAYAASWDGAALHLPQAQQLSTGDGIRVAVLDTGVDTSHAVLAGRLLPGYDFVDGDTDASEAGVRGDEAFGHGTHVAGLIAKVAPGARIMPLRVLDSHGNGNAWVLADALLHAVDPDQNPQTDDGAQVINLSLGTLDRTGLMRTIAQLVTCTPPEPTDTAAALDDPGYNDDKARCARQRPPVVVAAAGNDASSTLRFYPAAESAYGLISVAATTAAGTLATFTNRGNWIDIAAPGDAITSTIPGGYATWSGTSMAAPMVSGSVALMLSRFPSLGAEGVKRCLLDTTAAVPGARLRLLDPLAALRSRVRGGVCR